MPRRASPLPSAALVLFAVVALACALLPAGARADGAASAADLEDDALALEELVRTYTRSMSRLPVSWFLYWFLDQRQKRALFYIPKCTFASHSLPFAALSYRISVDRT